MSSKNKSDDEYEDALNEISATRLDDKANEALVEEIIQKQGDLVLDDKNDNVENQGEASASQDDSKKPEYIDEEIDEAQQSEQESKMSPEELLENKGKSDKLKLQGNEQFKNDDAVGAIDTYTQALKLCPLSYTKERAILYGNRAAAKIKIDSKKSAIDDCSKAILLWPEYVRALMRRAKLYECEDKLDEALEDYKRAYELDPGQREAHSAMIRLPPMIQERNERLKEEMLSKLKDLGNMILKPFGLSTANFQMQQDPNTGSYSVNFNQNSS